MTVLVKSGVIDDLGRQIERIFEQRASDPGATHAALVELTRSNHGSLRIQDHLKIKAGLACTLASQNRLKEALAFADEADELVQEVENPDQQVVFELRRIRVRQAVSDKRASKALRLALKNLKDTESMGIERLHALAHSDVAAVYGTSGDMRKALHHLQQSLQRTPETMRNEYGALMNNLGMVYMSVHREEEAIACFVQAREAFQAVDNDLQVAITLANEGQALEATGELDRAIELQNEALEVFTKGGYGHYQAASKYKIANMQLSSGRAEEAEKLYLESLELSSLPENGHYEHEARAAYGRFLLQSDRPEEAVAQFQRNVEIFRNDGSSFRFVTALEELANAQEASGDGQAALGTLKELLELQDSMAAEPPRSSIASEITELELSLERQVELVSATAGALVDANRKLSEQARELENLAATDHLTSLWNRRYFMTQLEAALQGSRRSDGVGFSLMFLDIDDFKSVNDRFGHETGDLVLQTLAEIMRGAVRATDVVARWGGEEFALLLHGTDLAAAGTVALKLQQAVNSHAWSTLGSGLSVTVSAGLIGSAVHHGASADEIINMADSLLYKAKLSGRNRIELAA